MRCDGVGSTRFGGLLSTESLPDARLAFKPDEMRRTVWYAFRPAASGPVVLSEAFYWQLGFALFRCLRPPWSPRLAPVEVQRPGHSLRPRPLGRFPATLLLGHLEPLLPRRTLEPTADGPGIDLKEFGHFGGRVPLQEPADGEESAMFVFGRRAFGSHMGECTRPRLLRALLS